MSDLRRYDKGRGSFVLRFFFTIILSFSMILSGIALPWAGGVDKAYAKDIGKKNQQACKACEKVRGDEAPDGYKNVLGNGSVYRGGNSLSGINNQTPLDNDQNDFAKPLPYGDIYVDTERLVWTNPNNFIIDIQDDRFQWVGVNELKLTDKNGLEMTNDPLESDKPLKKGTLDNPNTNEGFIAYVGELKSYRENITDKADNTRGYTNEIRPSGDYLYRITYLNAAVLPNGTRGNVVMTMKEIDIETSINVSEDNPHILTTKDGSSTYEYTKAVIPVQRANALNVSGGVADSEGNWVNEGNVVVKTKAEVEQAVNAANDNLPEGQKLYNSIKADKVVRHGIGGAYTFDIAIEYPDGQPVKGTMAYAAHDLDLPSYQNVWGRGDADPFMYAEGLSVQNGALSYALVPKYNHKDATTLAKGWIPDGISGSLESPLSITGGSGSTANGVRFGSASEKVFRDKDGYWTNSLFSYPQGEEGDLMAQLSGTILDFMGNNLNNSAVQNKTLNDNAVTDLVKKQLAGKITDSGGNIKAWDEITAEDIVNYLGKASYGIARDDASRSYDTGFAVLIDPKKTTFRWTASTYHSGNVGTIIFDSTLFTYIEQTHGTGGGIYLESYDLTSGCNPTPEEGVVTMGKGADATVTAVPEEGYRIKEFKIGGAGLNNPKTYTLKSLGLTPGEAKSVERDGITFEMNADGSVDVTFTNIEDPRHVHMDFAADYYFYKVWKTPKDSSVDIPETLKLTATPFVFEMTSVTVRGVIYKISNEGTTYTANGKTYHMTANSTIELGEGDDAKTYTLVGDKLVDSGGNEYRIATSTEQGNAKTFTVSSTGSDVSDGFVKVETDSDGNTVWKVKYPEEGREATSGTWPALPIETYEGSEHNYNHVQRNYWFVTETVPPAWTESYDNSTALAPGIVKAEDGEGTLWKEMATIYHSSAEKLIASKDDEKFAFLSPLSENVTHNGTTYTGWGGEITNEITPPEGTPKETYGAKNEPQYADGKSMFTVTTDKAQDGTDNEIEKIELIGPDGKPATSVKVNGGTYTIDQDGMITFTPDKDFVGDPPPVTVRGTDKNGLSAETTYTPHVRDVIKTVTRTIVYEYEDGTPVKDKDDNPLTVEQTVIFEGTINPDTGEIVYPSGSSGTMEEVPSDEINGYNVDRETVGEAVVYPDSDDLFEKVIYSPKGIKPTADETYGLPNTPQTGSPSFEMETPKLPDGTPNELTIKLIDPTTGEETDEKSVPAVDEDGNVVGTYTLNDNGTTTFTPNDGYVGNPQPLELVGKDKLDNVAKTTYTPHIVDPVDQDTATRTIHYTYLTKDGKKVTGDTTQTAVLHRHAKSVDPKTGEVLEWSDWEPATFPAVKNPDDKVNGKIWFTDDSAGEQTVTKPGRAPDVHIVYQKVPYTVKYLNGLRGKSDGKGDQKDVPYGEMVKGGNKVTPNSGYKFTGKYTYVIKDRDGNIIKTGETDDPTSVEIIGNIEFTPVYKKLPTAIYVDPATGRTIQKTLPFLDDNTEPDPPKDPTRKGYKFTGWKRVVTYDSQGNVESVVYEATWEPLSSSSGSSSGGSSGSSSGSGAKTGDSIAGLIAAVAALGIALAVIIVMIIRRRRRS